MPANLSLRRLVDQVTQVYALGNLNLGKIENAKAGRPSPPRSPTDDNVNVALEITLGGWLERAEAGPSLARFVHLFHTGRLPAAEWDHYARVRVVYSLLSAFGRVKGREMILQGMERYAAQTQTGGEFNVTMAYFWIQVVHFGICGMPPAPAPAATATAAPDLDYREDEDDCTSVAYLEAMLDEHDDKTETIFDDSESILSEAPSGWSLLDGESDDEPEDENSGGQQDDRDDEVHSQGPETKEEEDPESDGRKDVDEPATDPGFIRFLLLNPFVADEGLWREYYSEEVMFSLKARSRMALPDRRRLPNLVGREVISSSSFRGRNSL
ncbi:hypothetical protein C8R46DRAFT_1190550 [Mycena filopes]|nr:hypothetical protein C8R46DRAFT_1190550 [Mycena filopes]